MSINVHVSGNPISISRGKMVTADLDHCKKEFEKRRLMRLEQVRQQSKNIAEDVRNKVKREKVIQMKHIEEEGKQKLKNWQNRKLLELQTQYKKALKELGAGHKEAKNLEDEEALLEEKMAINQELSAKRGHKAACKLRSQANETHSNKNAITDRKKIVREIENARAAMVKGYKEPIHHSEPRVKKKKRRDSNDELKISIPDSDSDFHGSANSLSNITEDDEESTSCTCCFEESISSDIENNASSNSVKAARQPEDHSVIPPTIETREVAVNTPAISTSTMQNLTGSTKPTVHTVQLPSSSDYKQMAQPSVSTAASHLSAPPVSEPLNMLLKGDTRISDRIKRRGFSSQPQKITSPRPTEITEVPSNTAVRDHIRSRTCCMDCPCGCVNKRVPSKDLQEAVVRDRYKDFENRLPAVSEINSIDEGEGSKYDDFNSKSNQLKVSTSKADEIPSKPFIKVKTPSSVSKKSSGNGAKLKTTKKSPAKTASKPVSTNLSTQEKPSKNIDELLKAGSSKQHPVQMYDHPNRFGYEKNVPTSSFVEKIPAESLEVISDPDMEADWKEAQRKRQKDAQIRGRQALEKAKLQKDYEEMLKRLPLLQKKERICEIFNDKPEYHMSEERLKEKERAKQNQLENAYNKLFPNLQPAVVTLAKNQPDGREKDSSGTDSSHTLNVASWDVDFKAQQMFTPQEVRDILKSFTRQEPENRRAKLKELLKNLKLQKEELLREISALPNDESVDEIINDLRSFDTEVEDRTKSKHKRKTSRKRSRKENEADVSIDSSIDGSSSERSKGGSKEVVGKSPRKKAKIKSKVIILQNTSTQTTPKSTPVSTQDTSVQVTSSGFPSQESSSPAQLTNRPSRKPPVICKKLHVPCDCEKENKKPADNLCHIFIKLKDDAEPDVVVKSSDDAVKPVGVKTVNVGVQIPSTTMGSKSTSTDTKIDSVLEKSRTWKEQFSKNSLSTTSTSYLSPPDFQKKTRTDYFKKPQQKELSAIYSQSQELSTDPKLTLYIKKLLSMTRMNVDNLSVSSSTVETPSQSVIEIESNNPKGRLEDMVDAIKSKAAAYSPEYTPVPFNTSVSASSSQRSHRDDLKSAIPEKEISECSILAQYSEITDSCSKRIEALAAMIQQLRADKIKMLQVSKSPVTSDKEGKDASTKYMDLPEYKTDSKESSKSSSSSLDEEEIYKKLMEINHEYNGKIRKLNGSTDGRKEKNEPVQPISIPAVVSVPQDSEDGPSPNSTNQEILGRLQRLQGLPKPTSDTQNEQFEPFLSDIPRLPKFEPQEDNANSNHKRPPLSKGLTSIKKFNGNVSLVPHELSTIVEADSQISTKQPSPETSRDSVNLHLNQPQHLLAIPEIQEGVSSTSTPNVSVPKKSPGDSGATKTSVSTSLKDDSNKSLDAPSAALSSSGKSKELQKSVFACDENSCPEVSRKMWSSSSSDDMENIENMLRSIGMEWAIPTLHKTQEALALTSSSSSLDFSRKKPNTSTSISGSEVSLRDFLKKQVLKISSSTMLSEESIGSFLGECSELSGIQKNTNSAQDRSKRRTSTPLGSSKFMSSSKSNVGFSDSELSSIRGENTKSRKNKK